METIKIDKDITVFYITAKSFPDGVLQAHQSLHALIPFSTERKYFGLSRPEDESGKIIYRAAAEEMEPGEAAKLKLNTITLKKGNYRNINIHNYMQDVQAIGQAFQQLIAQPDIDPQGYCVELYVSDKDVQCMVRLAD